MHWRMRPNGRPWPPSEDLLATRLNLIGTAAMLHFQLAYLDERSASARDSLYYAHEVQRLVQARYAAGAESQLAGQGYFRTDTDRQQAPGLRESVLHAPVVLRPAGRPDTGHPVEVLADGEAAQMQRVQLVGRHVPPHERHLDVRSWLRTGLEAPPEAPLNRGDFLGLSDTP